MFLPASKLVADFTAFFLEIFRNTLVGRVYGDEMSLL